MVPIVGEEVILKKGEVEAMLKQQQQSIVMMPVEPPLILTHLDNVNF